MRRLAALIGVLLLAAVAAVQVVGSGPRTDGAGEARPRPPFTAGRGIDSARVFPPTRSDRGEVVVFLHGWGLVGPRAYSAWIRHLRNQGDTVIVPRYQRDLRTWSPLVADAALAGVRNALRRLERRPSSVVVAGHSVGGVLAVDYAARAADEGLPRARAVLAVYPGGALKDMPPVVADGSRVPARTKLVVVASATDQLDGPAPAQALFDEASGTGLPSRRRFVTIDDPVAGDHFAPAGASAAARETFWPLLDRLVDRG